MKLVVVGGVAAGASIAARTRRLDEFAEIIVLERGHHVSFANCGLPYFIGGVITDRSRLLVQTPESLREALDLDVRVGNEVVSIDRAAKTVTVRRVDDGTEYTESYDALALTPGAEAVRPPIPGIDLDGVHVLRRMGDMDQIKAQLDALLTEAASGRRGPVRAVVIGAGYIGLEMAENLRHRGAEVDVVELADQILPPIDHELSVPVESHLRSRGVAVHLETGAAALREADGGIDVELTNHEVLRADLVILSAGVRPNTALAREAGLELGAHGGIAVDTHMRTSDPFIWAAGDAVETPSTVLPGSGLSPLAGPANREARVAAENICGRDTEYHSTQGTSIVKVFDMVAGGTGATQRQLITAGVPHRAVHVHPSGHAGYYPGTAMMHLKVVFDPETGRVLGGQAAGFDGVDKRIDVLSVAVRNRLTVFDLEELELAYAPPFGSAKDPINMVGFVASNVVRGDLELWYAEDYPAAVEGARVIDVRTPEEFGIWHLPGAENVPLATLRSVCGDWDTSAPIRLYCAVGFRSYLAYRSLRQRGFTDLKTLSGGSTTFRAWHELDEPDVAAQREPMENYAETHSLFALAPTGVGASIDLDCTGLACPGPIMRLAETVTAANAGDEVTVHVSDPGFASDAPAWVKRSGHQLVSIEPEGPGYVAVIRKGGAGTMASARPASRGISSGTGGGIVNGPGKTSFVVFSGDMDKVLASFIIANGALAMGEEVSMFFTFWGLNALRREQPPKREKKLMDRMFGMMMPSSAQHLPLSTMNMAGMGPVMIKSVMKHHNVPSLPELIASAHTGGARLIGCTMTMDLLGIAHSDLMDGVELGGVATFLGEASESTTTLFI